MQKMIEIFGNGGPTLSINLRDLLPLIKNGERIKWKILWLEATWNKNSESILDFENKINNSSTGYSIGWNELIELSTQFDQILNLLLIGDENTDRLKKYDSDEEMRSSCAYCIELVDSTYWLVSSSDSISINSMIESLDGVKVSELK